MSVTVVIVTYSNRFFFLKKVLDSCVSSNVDDIIIVDNNSEKESKEKLKLFSEENRNIHIIRNENNFGSAKAYKQGLQLAYSLKNDFIWMLDDDNKPRENALKILEDFWQNKPNNVECLLSYRPDRDQYKRAIKEKNPEIVLSKRNSFYGFHVFDKLLSLFKSRRKFLYNQEDYGEVPYAPYGGMYFNKRLLDIIGYPNEKFYLYADDHDWSYRITDSGKKIMLLLNSIVDDVDTSWSISNKKEIFFNKIKNAPPFRVYYSFRNRIVFEKKYLIDNKFIYYTNMYLFTVILFLFTFKSETFKSYLKALKDGENNNLDNNHLEDINS